MVRGTTFCKIKIIDVDVIYGILHLPAYRFVEVFYFFFAVMRAEELSIFFNRVGEFRRFHGANSFNLLDKDEGIGDSKSGKLGVGY